MSSWMSLGACLALCVGAFAGCAQTHERDTTEERVTATLTVVRGDHAVRAEVQGPAALALDLRQELIGAVPAGDPEGATWLEVGLEGTAPERVAVDPQAFGPEGDPAVFLSSALAIAADHDFEAAGEASVEVDDEWASTEQGLARGCPMKYCDATCWCLYHVQFNGRTLVCSYSQCGGGAN